MCMHALMRLDELDGIVTVVFHKVSRTSKVVLNTTLRWFDLVVRETMRVRQ